MERSRLDKIDGIIGRCRNRYSNEGMGLNFKLRLDYDRIGEETRFGNVVEDLIAGMGSVRDRLESGHDWNELQHEFGGLLIDLRRYCRLAVEHPDFARSVTVSTKPYLPIYDLPGIPFSRYLDHLEKTFEDPGVEF